MSRNGDYEEDEDVASSDDDDEETEDVFQVEPRPNAVYNSMALHEKLEEIGWPDGLDWMHTLCVDYRVEDGDIDVNDDLSREMAFYTQALEGTREAFTKLLQSGKPFLRPPDYYAEMVKSDTHMLKVKDSLLSQQKQIEEAEERRKARESKRFSKEVQAQKLKQRAQEKKQNIESVKKWRKMRQDGGYNGGDDELPEGLDEDDSVRGSKKRKFEPNTPRSFKKFKGSASRSPQSFGSDENDNVRGLKKRKFEPNTPRSSKKFKGSASRSPQSFGRGRGDSTPEFGSKEIGARKRVSLFNNAADKSKRNTRSPFGSVEKGSRAPAPWDRSGGKKTEGFKSAKGKDSSKRQSKNTKYGHGGRKSFKKVNTAESSAGFPKENQKKRKV